MSWLSRLAEQQIAKARLKGQLQGDGFSVEANGVMAKCPSKYEAKPGSAPPSQKY
jgi:cytochrome c-type biogenesis protein CcmE